VTRSRFAPLLVALLALSGVGPASAASSATVTVDGRALLVPAPVGMRPAPQLESSYMDAAADFGGDLKAVFRPDSALAALSPGRASDPRASAALVLVYRGALAQTPGEFRARLVYGGNTDQALRARSSDTTLFDRIRRTLHDHPEGTPEVTLPSVPGERVGVASFRLGDDAVGWLTATARGPGRAGGVQGAPRLEATATAVVAGRVIGLVMVGNVRPTTRTVPGMRRAMREWVEAVIAANAPGGAPPDSVGR
jgi:hypothetical protein